MSTFFNFDPLTGVREDFDYDADTGVAYITHSQDVSAAIEKSKYLQNTGAGDVGIKNEMWSYATLPPIIQIKLREMGIDIFSQDIGMRNRLYAAIDEHFPAFKNTTKRHRVVQNRHI